MKLLALIPLILLLGCANQYSFLDDIEIYEGMEVTSDNEYFNSPYDVVDNTVSGFYNDYQYADRYNPPSKCRETEHPINCLFKYAKISQDREICNILPQSANAKKTEPTGYSSGGVMVKYEEVNIKNACNRYIDFYEKYLTTAESCKKLEFIRPQSKDLYCDSIVERKKSIFG